MLTHGGFRSDAARQLHETGLDSAVPKEKEKNAARFADCLVPGLYREGWL
jgi:hypothetical protein